MKIQNKKKVQNLFELRLCVFSAPITTLSQPFTYMLTHICTKI